MVTNTSCNTFLPILKHLVFSSCLSLLHSKCFLSICLGSIVLKCFYQGFVHYKSGVSKFIYLFLINRLTMETLVSICMFYEGNTSACEKNLFIFYFLTQQLTRGIYFSKRVNFFPTYLTRSLNFCPISNTHFYCFPLNFFPNFNFG